MEVNAYEDTITFNMDPKSLDEVPLYMFLCPRKEDMANLIASYSPAHRNWKQVCAMLRGLAANEPCWMLLRVHFEFSFHFKLSFSSCLVGRLVLRLSCTARPTRRTRPACCMTCVWRAQSSQRAGC